MDALTEFLLSPLKNKQNNIKIGARYISNLDIDRFNEESVDFSFPIYPTIYDILKLSPMQGDILVGYVKDYFDYNDDTCILIRGNVLYSKVGVWDINSLPDFNKVVY